MMMMMMIPTCPEREMLQVEIETRVTLDQVDILPRSQQLSRRKRIDFNGHIRGVYDKFPNIFCTGI